MYLLLNFPKPFVNPSKEGRTNLLNVTLNTFYYRYIGVGHRIVHHTDSATGNPLLSDVLYALSNRIMHTTAYGIPAVESLVGTGKSPMVGPLRFPGRPLN